MPLMYHDCAKVAPTLFSSTFVPFMFLKSAPNAPPSLWRWKNMNFNVVGDEDDEENDETMKMMMNEYDINI